MPNAPDSAALANLVRLTADVLEPARVIVGPLRVNSGFRSLAVNKAVGGVKTSQHLKGEAADVVPLKMSLYLAFKALKESRVPFDQLIWEPTWLHISVAPLGKKPRCQCLKAHMENGRMVYEGA